MRTSSTFSILFWMYTSRAVNNQADIYVRITVNGKRVNISLKQKVDINLWDSNRQKVKGNSAKAKQINFYLDETKSNLVQIYRNFKSENKTPLPEHIKAVLLGEDKKAYTLQDIFDYHNEKMVHKLAEKTMCHYRTSQKYILAYIGKEYNSANIDLKDLDYAFIIGFESFLRSFQPSHYQGKIGNNAVMKHIQRLRRMITLAYQIEWINRDPFVKFKPTLEKKEREFLSNFELKNIENLTLYIERLSVVQKTVKVNH